MCNILFLLESTTIILATWIFENADFALAIFAIGNDAKHISVNILDSLTILIISVSFYWLGTWGTPGSSWSYLLVDGARVIFEL